MNEAELNKWKRKEYEQILERLKTNNGVADDKEWARLLMELLGCRGLFDVIPLSIQLSSDEKKTLNDEEKWQRRYNKCREWINRINEALDSYAIITDKSAKITVVQLLILYMAIVENNNTYKDYFIVKNRVEKRK